MSVTQDVYPSRTGEKETIVERLDPVVYGSADIPSENALKKEQLDFFEHNGYLILPDFVATKDVERMKNEAMRLKNSLVDREELVIEPGSDELRSIFSLHSFSEDIREFASSSRILDPVMQIIGDEVYIMQSRLNIKPAYKGKSFPWHSDFETWHVEDGMPRMRAVTAWVMLTESNDYNGPLYVIPGSHKKYISCAGRTGENNHKQSLVKQVLGVPKPESIDEIIQKKGIKAIHGTVGTLVIHDCNLVHGSPDNISPWSREILMFVYNSFENRVGRPFSGLKSRPEHLSVRSPIPLSPH